MILGLTIDVSEAIWNIIIALGSGLASGLLVAFSTQRWIEKRERRNRRDERRLNLYLDIVDLVLGNEMEKAKRGFEGIIPPVELQLKQISISHRLKLFGSPTIVESYEKYKDLVNQEISNGIGYRPEIWKVEQARDELIDLMSKDIQSN